MKRVNTKLFIAIAMITMFLTDATCQEKSGKSYDKPMRIGIKVGIPNIAGLNFERTIGKKFALSVDAGYFPITIGNAKIKPSYFEGALNYYFNDKRNGFYAQAGVGRLGFNATYTDETYGTGKVGLGLGFVSFRLGAKIGNSFYIRPEIGYGTLLTGTTFTIAYTDPSGNTTSEADRVPGSLDGGVIASFGFGFAF